jgi:hypothetical protein
MEGRGRGRVGEGGEREGRDWRRGWGREGLGEGGGGEGRGRGRGGEEGGRRGGRGPGGRAECTLVCVVSSFIRKRTW